MLAHLKDPRNAHSPVALVKLSKNKGQDAFFGQKWNQEVLVEDDGTTLSGLTFVEHDTERGMLFAGGELYYLRIASKLAD
jgi:arylesterase/paraoxonase